MVNAAIEAARAGAIASGHFSPLNTALLTVAIETPASDLTGSYVVGNRIAGMTDALGLYAEGSGNRIWPAHRSRASAIGRRPNPAGGRLLPARRCAGRMRPTVVVQPLTAQRKTTRCGTYRSE